MANCDSVKHEICEGCLCSGRKLVPIKQYLRLYHKLIEESLSKITSRERGISKVPLMCWECRSYLRNTLKFQKRAEQAYAFLVTKLILDSKKLYNPHLSTLTTFVTNTPDYEISHDYTRNENGGLFFGKQKMELEITGPVHDEVVKYEMPEVIKEEAEVLEEIKVEDDCEDAEDALDDVGQTETYEESIQLSGKMNGDIAEEVIRKQKTIERRKSSLKAKYKAIRLCISEDQDYSNLYLKTEVAEGDRERIMDRARKREKYVTARYKCEICVIGFHNEKNYEKHMRKYHLKSSKYECNVCGIRTDSKSKLALHIKRHRYKYVCKLCGHECLKNQDISYHLVYTHERLVECRKCGLQFLYKEFYKHYNNRHKWFICDHCGYKTIQKHLLINHIRIKHGENVCKYCGRRYAHYHSMTRHIALRHTRGDTEQSYCVECNIQFDNLYQYTEHLKKSVKHKPKTGFPCPDCKKVYAKQTCMKNHYKYVHLQKTNHYCQECSRYFLNGFRLRTHIASYHNKIQPPRNKICSYCGRGFRTNRILDNHIRTHTGERPFSCAHCTATFAQKSALVTHTRAIHKIMMRYAQAD